MSIHYFVAVLLSSIVRFITGINARWINCEPDRRQRIYFANHASHFDAIVIWSALPPEVRQYARPVAARDYWEKTALRRYLAKKVFNVVLVDRAGTIENSDRPGSIRSALKSITDMIDAMGQQYSLIIFPEGTRGDGINIQPFKGGIYHIAKRRPDVELVPVYIENLNRILPKGEFLPVPLLSSMSFGEPLKLQEGEKKAVFIQRAQDAVEKLRR
jgi:1-acyl-sn-glycerol-3-phosphate acyltransferase